MAVKPNYGPSALVSLVIMVGVFGGLGYFMLRDGLTLKKTFGGITLRPGDVVGVKNSSVRVLTVMGDSCTGVVLHSSTLFPGQRISFDAQEAIL